MSGQPSFEKIHYGLRPAKNIERKMLSEMFGRLSVFRPLYEYAYIGFGSVYFTDFSLLHRQWGISPMYSIEGSEDGIERAQFNAPFSCIKVLPGRSYERLPEIVIDMPTIVWLDYDTELGASMLQDVATVLKKQCNAGFSGAVLAVTVDVESDRLKNPKSVSEDERDDDEWPEDPVDQFKRIVGNSNTPPFITGGELQGAALGETYRSVIAQKINSVMADIEGWGVSQFANFRYADKAEMATYAWAIYDQKNREIFETSRIDKFPFSSTTEVPYEVESPWLTYREIHALGPEVHQEKCPATVPVKEVDFQKFKKIYRYFPAFVEAEL